MALKRRKPATDFVGHGLRGSDQVCRPIAFENATSTADIQARRIAERFRVPIDMARVVASLAFGEVRA